MDVGLLERDVLALTTTAIVGFVALLCGFWELVWGAFTMPRTRP